MKLFGIFAKFWQPGAVKTRLAAAIGDELASEIYRQSLATLLARFRTAADCRRLVFTPEDRRPEFAHIAGDHWQLQSQVGGDLGAKMQAFFAAAFAESADQVVLIGSDSPTLPHQFVEAAFANLNTNSVVLGPTPDGGYYLIGAARSTPPIFDGIAWSTREVWPQTVAKLRRADIRFAILPEWYDIDTRDDLRRLERELQTPACAGAEFDELRTAIRDVIPQRETR